MSSKAQWLRGVFPALVTPFTREQEVDEEALRRLVRHLLPHVDGFVPNGTTGEFVYLSPEERRKVLDIVLEEAGGKPVIAGTGAAGTREAIELAKAAQAAGASACLVVTPYYLHPSDKGVYQHFYEIASAVDIPIVLYNIPQTVDRYLPRTVIEDLADIENIVALKDSSGNLAYMLEVMEYTEGRLKVMVGHDEVVLPALAAGAAGMILASANVYPEVWRELYEAVQRGDLERARRLQRKVQKLSRIFVRYGGAVAVKAALRMMGLSMGAPRRPLKGVGGALVHEDRAEIRLELEKLGKLASKEWEWHPTKRPLEERFTDVGITAQDIRREKLRVGTGEAGEGVEKAQVDLVAGPKGGVLGEAYAYQLTYPRQGHEALTTILEPNLTVRPSTLIVPTVPLKDLRQANMIYGPTQSAVARAIVDGLEEGLIPRRAMDEEVMLVLATVHPKALDRHALYHNVYRAMRQALQEAFRASRP